VDFEPALEPDTTEAEPTPESAPGERWRVGTSPGTHGRTIYRHTPGGPERGELIGVMDTGEAAAHVVEAVNQLAERLPNPLPAGGSGWGRQRLTELVAEARRLGPVDDMPDQVEALLADLDRLAELAERRGRWVQYERDIADRRQSERDAARRELAAAVEANHQLAAEVAELGAERERLRKRVHEAVDQCQRRHAPYVARCAEFDNWSGWARARFEQAGSDYWTMTSSANRLVIMSIIAERDAARRDAELWERAAGDMEARDRHAAADTLSATAARLAHSGTWADPLGRWTSEQAEAAGAQKQLMVDRVLDAAAEVRAGTRPVPGGPEPAPAGGEEPDHAE
jgi:hypothetical protein